MRDDGLKAAKKKLLEFAQFHSQIYLTNSDGDLLSAEMRPSIGYLPCPDWNADGKLLGAETSCRAEHSNVWVGMANIGCENDCLARLPAAISSRNFYFAPAGRYHYVFHHQLSARHDLYGFNEDNRYQPLTLETMSSALDIHSLKVNGEDGYLAVLIDAGEDGLSLVNQQLNGEFVSQNSSAGEASDIDRVVGIHLSEWQLYMQQLVCYYKVLPEHLNEWHDYWLEKCQ